MKKTLFFFIITSLLVACASSSEKKEEESVVMPVEELVVAEDFEVLEEEEENLSAYQIAAKAHPAKDKLPYQVFFKENKELYRIGSLNFVKIVNTYKNYFLLAYRTYATEVEVDYYFTFDYKGNQLDAANVNTIAIDLDGEIVFTTGSAFQVNKIKKQIEWDEADIVEVGEATRDTSYYLLTHNGQINNIDEIAYYNKELKRLYPARILHAQYKSQLIAVSSEALEHVEGGGMSRKYLSVVNEYDLEIGVVMYEMSSAEHPFTLSIAILEEGNILVSAILCDIDGNTVLRLKSNRSENPEKGPYDFNYYTYTKEILILQPILTKALIDNEPNITVVDENTATANIRILNKNIANQ